MTPEDAIPSLHLFDETADVPVENHDEEVQRDMLQKVKTDLENNPDQVNLQLLMAELCFVLREDSRFVAAFLREHEADLGQHRRYQRLRQRVNGEVQKLLSSGRAGPSRFSERTASSIMADLDRACILSDYDPSVCIAAALAYIDQIMPQNDLSKPEIRQLSSLLYDVNLDRSSQTTNNLDVAERYLNLGLTNIDRSDKRFRIIVHRLTLLWLLRVVYDAVAPIPEVLHQAEDTPIDDDLLTLVLAYVVRIVAAALREDNAARADRLLGALETFAPDLPAVRLLRAEYLSLNGASAGQRRTLLEEVVRLTDQPHAYRVTALISGIQQLVESTTQAQVDCERCGYTYNPLMKDCPMCGNKPPRRRLFSDPEGDKREKSDANPTDREFALSGLAHLSLTARDFMTAVHLIDQIKTQPFATTETNTLNAHFSGVPIGESGLSSALRTLAQLLVDDKPEALLNVRDDDTYRDPFLWDWVLEGQCLRITEMLIGAGEFDAAAAIGMAALVAHPDSKSLVTILESLSQRAGDEVNELREKARIAFEQGRLQDAIDAVDAIMHSAPRDVDMRHIRARALRELGRMEQACRDFQFVSQHAADTQDEALAIESALAAAELYLKLDNLKPAYELMKNLPDTHRPEATLRDIQRRMSGKPYIHIQPADALVMHDTLKRDEHVSGYHAFFAIRVASTVRQADVQQVAAAVIEESLQFSGILNSLYHTDGDPVFALRYIRHLGTHGEAALKIALLARVTASTESDAERLANELWSKIRNVLPGARMQLYQYQPIFDRAALEGLLAPFEAGSVSEVVRREMPATESQPYFVCRFQPGDISLSRLMHSLLDQDTDTMLSIHLIPTTLTLWEQSAWKEQLEHTGHIEDDLTGLQGQSTVNRVAERSNAYSMYRGIQSIMRELQPAGFMMRVQIAVKQVVPSIVSQRIASALFNARVADEDGLSGGFELLDTLTDEELEIAQRNLAQLDVEAWGFTSAPEGLSRMRWLVGQREATIALRLPVPGSSGIAGLDLLSTRPIAPPTDIPDGGTVLGKSVYRRNGSPVIIRQINDDRRRHTYLVGKTGSGKTTLMQRMALQDIERGEGVCVIDPHGDLVEDILARIPENRRDDVILFDASDYERPIGLNLLEHNDEMHRHMIVNEFIGLLIRMYDPVQQGIVGPRFQHNVRHAMLTAMEFEGATLLEVVRVLTDREYVKNLIPQIRDPIVKAYWTDQVANTSDWHKSEILDYIVSKFSRFVGDRRVRNVVGQRKSALNFREIMDTRKILLVNLSKGKIGAENAQFLGLLFVQTMLIAALGRAAVNPAERPDFYLYVDEFQNFATELFGVVLSEGRKYGVAAVCANQYLTQIPSVVRDAVFGNVGTLICFRLGVADTMTVLPELQPGVDASDIMNLPQYTAYTKLLMNGNTGRVFPMQTLPEEILPDARLAEQIRMTSRQTYGRSMEEITRDIERRMRSVPKNNNGLSALFKK